MNPQHNGCNLNQSKNNLRNAHAWNYALMDAMRREIVASSAGLDHEKYGQLPPGSSITTNITLNVPDPTPDVQPTPLPAPAPPVVTPAPATGTGHKLAVAALLGTMLGIGGGTLGGLALLNKPTPSLTTPVPTLTTPAPAVLPDGEFDDVLYAPAVKDAQGNVTQPEKVLERVRYRRLKGAIERRMPDGSWQPVPKAP